MILGRNEFFKFNNQNYQNDSEEGERNTFTLKSKYNPSNADYPPSSNTLRKNTSFNSESKRINANKKDNSAANSNMKYVKDLELIVDDTKPYLPPKKMRNQIFTNISSNFPTSDKTLVLDLDETLVHSSLSPYPGIEPDMTINMTFENKPTTIYVLKRPFAEEFLMRMSKIYEIIIFTASIKDYADEVINRLDPHKKIDHRLYRDCCTRSGNFFVKNLKRLGRNLKDVILVDNNPISYALNRDNGVPIITWHDDKNDIELMKMVPFLEYLAKIPDVRGDIMKVTKNGTVDYKEVYSLIMQEQDEPNHRQLQRCIR